MECSTGQPNLSCHPTVIFYECYYKSALKGGHEFSGDKVRTEDFKVIPSLKKLFSNIVTSEVRDCRQNVGHTKWSSYKYFGSFLSFPRSNRQAVGDPWQKQTEQACFTLCPRNCCWGGMTLSVHHFWDGPEENVSLRSFTLSGFALIRWRSYEPLSVFWISLRQCFWPEVISVTTG